VDEIVRPSDNFYFQERIVDNTIPFTNKVNPGDVEYIAQHMIMKDTQLTLFNEDHDTIKQPSEPKDETISKF
jgi:hypothetical protein